MRGLVELDVYLKLTLEVSLDIVERAVKYAEERHRAVSQELCSVLREILGQEVSEVLLVKACAWPRVSIRTARGETLVLEIERGQLKSRLEEDVVLKHYTLLLDDKYKGYSALSILAGLARDRVRRHGQELGFREVELAVTEHSSLGTAVLLEVSGSVDVTPVGEDCAYVEAARQKLEELLRFVEERTGLVIPRDDITYAEFTRLGEAKLVLSIRSGDPRLTQYKLHIRFDDADYAVRLAYACYTYEQLREKLEKSKPRYREVAEDYAKKLLAITIEAFKTIGVELPDKLEYEEEVKPSRSPSWNGSAHISTL